MKKHSGDHAPPLTMYTDRPTIGRPKIDQGSRAKGVTLKRRYTKKGKIEHNQP
jgi:hypothetical protein